MSQQPRNHRGQRERNGGGHRENRDHRPRRDPHEDRPPSSERSSTQPPYYPRESPPPAKHTRNTREEHEESKCTHICSRRGIVLICSVLTNALVLVCIVAAQVSMSGMSAMGGLGGGNLINAHIPFEGLELQQVRELDAQFSQMRAPGVYGGLAFCLTLGILSLLFVVSGNKPAHALARKLLVGQFVFVLLGAVGYVVAVALYLHFVIGVNATEVCVRRERLYARNGLTWMNCDVGGADAAVALFGLITAILYAVATVLTAKTLQYVRRYHQERQRYEAERHERHTRSHNAPLQPDTHV